MTDNTRGPASEQTVHRILRDLSERHLYTVLAALLGIWALFSVPQFTNLWQQLPPMTTSMWRLWLWHALFLAVLGWFYVPSWFVVIGDWQTIQLPRRLSPIFGALTAPAELASSWLVSIVFRRSPRAVLWTAVALACGSGLLIHFFGSPAHSNRLYPLAGCFCKLAGLLFLSIGCWLAKAVLSVQQGPAWRVVGRTLAWLTIGILLGEFIWVCASYQWLQMTYRIYSVWSLFHFFSVLVVAASLVDFCHSHTTWPVRQLTFIVLIALVWAQRPQAIQDASRPVAATSAAMASPLSPAKLRDQQWYDFTLARLKSMPPGPVVVVAASGGGSRAAIFTGLVLEQLSRTPMNTTGLCGPAVADGNAPATLDAKKSTWAENILLISSVSGGSLATADYVVKGVHRKPREELRNTDERELLTLVQSELAALVDPQKKGDADFSEVEASIASAQKTLAGIETPDAKCHWILDSALVDDMATDFMAPILRGCFSPGTSRGDSLAYFWDQRLHWKSAEQVDWDSRPSRFDPQRHPLMVLNACDIDRGARLAIGFPRLPAGILRDPALATAGPLGNGEPASLSDLEGDQPSSLTLARAVRLSSNFPWGFPIAELSPQSNPKLNTPVRILDGAIIDNTGIDTLFYLFRGLQAAADANTSPQAVEIVDELRRRGVVMIEIDSGSQPVNSGKIGLFSGLAKPLEALNNALYSNAEQAKGNYLSRVKELAIRLDSFKNCPPLNEQERSRVKLLQDGLEHKLPPLVFHHRFRCNHIENQRSEVMTAWALGPRDEAVVIGQFLGELPAWQEFADSLQPQFQTLQLAVREADNTLLMVRMETRMSALLEKLTQIGAKMHSLAQLVRSHQPDEVIASQRDAVVAEVKAVRRALNELTKLAKDNPQSQEFCSRLADVESQLGSDTGRLAQIKALGASDIEQMLAVGSTSGDSGDIAGLAQQTAAAMKAEAQQPLQRVNEATRVSLDNRRRLERSAAEKDRFYEQIQKR